jgi:DNA-binding beta-propeller fold protein YncE
MSRRLLFGFLLFALALVGGERRALQSQSAVWPRWDARFLIEVYKVAGKEMTDLKWLHLHHGDPEARTVGLGVYIIDNINPEPLTNFADIQIRYMVHGKPVSEWLRPPFTFTLELENGNLPEQDGFHDVSVDVQGARRMDFKPSPIILHLGRGRGASPLVPLLNLDCEYCRYDDVALKQFGPGVVYVDWHTRNFKGYPINPAVTPWHTDPAHGDLYQEEMAPHSDLFGAEPMWWEEPPGTMDAGAKFVRALQPKMVDDSIGNFSYSHWQWRGTNADYGFTGLRSLPYKDGPRAVSWTSPYVSGVVDATGGLVFVDKGGPLRYMKPDGEVITVAGWRVKLDKDPVYFLKPFNDIRANMELRGTWTSGQYAVREDQGFHAPTDVTIDSRNEDVWYVAGFDDHCIWKVVVDRAAMTGTVSVLAGDPKHSAGYADGPATAARFNGPISLTFNPIDQKIYVSDLRNDTIRRVDPDTGATTTIAGRPGQGARVAASGGAECYATDPVPGCFLTDPQKWRAAPARGASRFEVAAGSPVKADCYLPMPIRADSQGRLVVLDVGFASIRQINPATGETKLLGNVEGRLDRGGLIGFFGLAVDRWGNAGPKDGIYWFQTVSGGVADGEDPNDRHTNELLAWMPPGGGKSKWVSGKDWGPCPDAWGPRECTDVPHYPWMVAVDPRGALYVSGVGEHGITRWRVRRSTDPVPTNWIDYVNAKSDWAVGSTGLGPNGHSLAVKFGWEGHNYLGFADLWDPKYQKATDQQLLDAFEIPVEVRNDSARRARVLDFMRLNTGVARARK